MIGLYQLVSGQLGLNVGVNEVTTDEWQGSEATFPEAFFNRTNATYQGQLEYDQSTQGVEVHVSSQIRDHANNDSIGAPIIGQNIQRVIHAN